jgi:nucleoid-associated protein EbfC
MGSGFSKMKKQARLFEQQLESAQNALKQKIVTGVSGNGLVTVTTNGEKKLLSIAIKPECVDAADVEGLQDLIKAACENAYSQLEDTNDISLDSFLNG